MIGLVLVFSGVALEGEVEALSSVINLEHTRAVAEKLAALGLFRLRDKMLESVRVAEKLVYIGREGGIAGVISRFLCADCMCRPKGILVGICLLEPVGDGVGRLFGSPPRVNCHVRLYGNVKIEFRSALGGVEPAEKRISDSLGRGGAQRLVSRLDVLHYQLGAALRVEAHPVAHVEHRVKLEVAGDSHLSLVHFSGAVLPGYINLVVRLRVEKRIARVEGIYRAKLCLVGNDYVILGVVIYYLHGVRRKACVDPRYPVVHLRVHAEVFKGLGELLVRVPSVKGAVFRGRVCRP